MTPPRCLPAQTPTILSFSGPDAVRFLSGQMTQAVEGLDTAAKPSCITNAKGRLEHFVSICVGPEESAIWVVSDHDDPDSLRARLERYLIADDVEIQDLTGEWRLIHADGPLTGAEFHRQAMGPFGEGFDHWWKAGEEPSIAAVAPATLEALRIEHGLPAWGHELEAGLLPPEAGLDRTAISYHKGCYIGQEVLSRIKAAGKVNRRLAILEISQPAAIGDPVLLENDEVGQLTSVSAANCLAFAYLSKKTFDTSSLQTKSGVATRVRWA